VAAQLKYAGNDRATMPPSERARIRPAHIVEQARAAFLRLVRGAAGRRTGAPARRAGRVLSLPLRRAKEPIPPFDRAAMDGFALRARRHVWRHPNEPFASSSGWLVAAGPLPRDMWARAAPCALPRSMLPRGPMRS